MAGILVLVTISICITTINAGYGPDCIAPADPTNGAVTYPGVWVGAVATYSCDDGYQLVGPATATCQFDTTWSTPPICVPADCQLPIDHPNGQVTFTGLMVGDVATYICDAGHQLHGSSSATCQSNGTWSASAICVLDAFSSTGYLGCYRENRRRRLFMHNPGAISPETTTPSRCRQICGGLHYTYAGLTQGKICFCTSNMPVADQIESTEMKCSTPCIADTTWKCGSLTHLNIYTSLLPVTATSMDPSPQPVQTGNTVILTSAVVTDGSYAVTVNYGDDAGSTAFVNDDVGLLNRTYNQAGTYTVMALVTDVTYSAPLQFSMTTVEVQSVTGDVLMSCPAVLATYDTSSSCIVQVTRGTNMNVTVDIDGAASIFPIGDAMEFGFGYPAMEKLAPPYTTVGHVIPFKILHVGYPAEHRGVVVGWEYFAMALGVYQVHIYRPDCGANEYCSESSTCVTPGTCTSACVNGYCSDLKACCSGPPTNSYPLLPTYSLVASHAYLVPDIGYGFVPFPADVHVQPGDILTHDPPVSGIIATSTGFPDCGASARCDYRCSSLEGALAVLSPGSSCFQMSVVHSIKMVYSNPAEVFVPLYFTQPGTVTLTVTASNRDAGIGGSSTNSSTITVVEGVNASIPVAPVCIEAGVVTTLSLEPFTGTPVIVYWDFGDGGSTSVDSSPTNQVTYTYVAVGTFNLTANITNAISFKHNITSVCVEERITGLIMTGLPNQLEVGLAYPTIISMSSGTSYTCAVTIFQPDGTSDSYSNVSLLADYTFNKPGDLNVEVSCSNNINTATFTLVARAEERITNAALTPQGAIMNVPFDIIVSWDTGTGVSVTLTYDSINEPMTVNSGSRQATSGTKTEPVTGPHPVTVRVENTINVIEFNATFYIEVEITHAVLSCTFRSPYPVSPPVSDYTVVTLNNWVDCSMAIQAGTSAVVTIDWGDGSAPYTHSVGAGQAWLSNPPPAVISHEYTIPMYCPLSVKVANSFNEVVENFPVWVLIPVDNTEIDPVSPAAFTPPASVDFTWTVSGQPPNKVTCHMEWGDGIVEDIENCDVITTMNHVYRDRSGDLTLSYTLSNHISSKSGTTPVYIVTPIENNTCYSIPDAGLPGAPIQLVFKSDRAPGAGVLDLTFDCGAAGGGVTGPRKRIYNSPGGEDSEPCQFTDRGSFPTNILATSRLETVSCDFNIQIMYPVTEDFTVTSNAPIDFRTDPTCRVEFSFSYTGTPLPEQASIEFQYGDGTTSGPLTFGTTMTDVHNYVTHGHYITTVRVYNLASEIIRTVPSGCYDDFVSASMTVLRKPELPLDSPDLPGFGVAEDKFRTDETVRIHTNLIGGTFVHWDVTAAQTGGATYAANSTNTSLTSLTVPDGGVFTITAQAKNPIYSGPILTKDIEMMVPVSNIGIQDDGIVINAYDYNTFHITMASYGTAMCVAVDNGEDPFLNLYGDSATCAGDATRWNNGQYDSTVDVMVPFDLRYQYFSDGLYTIDMYAWNAFSNEAAQFTFTVSGIDCSAPNIDIKQRRRNFRYPLQFHRSKRIKIIGITDIACPDTLINTKKWTAVKWNSNYNVAIEEIDITGLTSSINSELAFDPLYLDYGEYKLNYKVTMITVTAANGAEFFGQAETFIEVGKSEVVVQLFENGVSSKTVGPATRLTLAPKQYSYDPDIATGLPDVFDSFEMACRDVTNGEAFPDSSTRVSPANLTDLPPNYPNNGGCFKSGPGWIYPFDGSVTFVTSILTPNHVYEFLIVGYKDTRSANFTASITVAAAQPPEFTIDFKIPGILSSNREGKLFNPNSEQGLIRTLLSDCGGCTYTYRWEVYAYDNEYCGVSDCWRNLAYLSQHIEGLDTFELALRTGLFEFCSDTSKFQVRLRLTNVNTGISGSTTLNLVRNTPPYNGTCTITPTSGIAAQSNFTIACNGFIDDDHEIVDYQVTCNANGNNFDVIGGSEGSWDSRTLPMGDSTTYTLQCSVTVTDYIGGAATYPIDPVKVEPLPLNDLKAQLDMMVTSDDDPSDVVDAVANLQETASYANSFADMFTEMQKDDEFSEYAGMGTAVSFESTGLGETTVRPGAFTQETTDPAKMEAYEKTRDNMSKLIGKVVGTLEKCTVESPAETVLVSNTIEKMSKNKANLARKTQGDMTNLLKKGVTNMKNNKKALTVEDIVKIGSSTIAACGNIELAAALAVERPTNTDLDSQNDAIAFYDTSMDSAAPVVEMSSSDDDALTSGKRSMNSFEQLGFEASNLRDCSNIKEDLVSILSDVKPISTTPHEFKSGSTEVSVTKSYPKDLVNQTRETGAGKIKIPDDILDGDSGEEPLIMTLTAKSSGGTAAEDGPVGKYSREISMSFKYANGTKREVRNMKKPVTLYIGQDPNQPASNITAPVYTPNITDPDQYLYLHQMQVKSSRASLMLVFRPTNVSSSNQLLVLINHGEVPDLDPAHSKVKAVCMIPSNTHQTGNYGGGEVEDPYTCFVDADIVETGGSGKWRFGVRQLLPSELNAYPDIASLPTTVPSSWRQNKQFEQDYELKTIEATCAYSEEGSKDRKTDGCKASRLSTADEIRCESTHLTSFAGGWVVVPNTIDFDMVFSNADFLSNPTLYITEIVIVAIYIIAMIWARHKDKQDLTKLGLAPLLDNSPRDRYYYEIYVSTGMRRNAGTESKIHFILSGENDETDVRTFTDKKRKIFERDSTCGFLMAVPYSLGALSYLRVWHDNSGKGKHASWYLNHLVIRDVQTDKKYFFIANRWFAVEEDDGQVDRVIPVAGKEQMTEFSYLFQERATKNLNDGHLWFSVVARPPQSRFTRCQRVSCCLCLLFISMLANAMFYGTETSNANAYTIGPFAISARQIYIGIASNIIIFPINFFIILLFRRSRPRKPRPSRVEEALMKSKQDHSTSVEDINPRVSSSLATNRPGSSFLLDAKRSESALSRPETSLSTVKAEKSGENTNSKKKKKREFPWWVAIVAWILLWVCVLVSAAFVTFYGISFEDTKCKEWITSMVISFLTSIFLTQPIKVFLFAIIFSLIIKNPGGDDDEEEDEGPRKLKDDEELLHEEECGIVSPWKPLYKPKPPNQKSLEAARVKRLKEIQMWGVIREILLYAFFLMILIVISYRSVNTNSYNYKFTMEKVFIHTNDTEHDFMKVKNVRDFWIWARTGMLRGLRAGPYYNNYPPFYLRGYINDKNSRLMGYATLRQVRIKPNTCTVASQMYSVIDECNSPYSISQEQDGTFAPGWNSTNVTNTTTREEYTYLDGKSLNGYPYWGEMAVYGGGGYIVRLNKDYLAMVDHFTQLESEKWIDKYTRAVFLEFTVYNPSINLFSISTLLAEFRPSDGVFPSFRFEPCQLLPYMNSVLIFQITCEIIYLAFTIFFIVKESRNIYRQRLKYFTQFWNLIEVCIIAMSVTAIVIYFYRLVCINELTDYFNETNGNGYMKFQYVGYWSELFNYIVGFMIFFATIKFLKLLRFNKRVSLLADTLKNSQKELMHFGIVFNVVFLAFIQVFYLIYHNNIKTFKTFVRSLEAGVVMMMGKFDIYAMIEVNSWLTQIFLFLFVVSLTFIVVNMFLAILNDTFGAVRSDTTMQQNDYEIVEFMISRFKLWTGIGKNTPTAINPAELEARNKQVRLEEQIDAFPEHIERLMASISHIYLSDKNKSDDFFEKIIQGKECLKNAPRTEFVHPPPKPGSTRLHPPPMPGSTRLNPHPKPGSTRLSHGAMSMTDVQTD